MQEPKSLSVGDTVWALWPGSRKYYEATVLDVRKSTVHVNFKDGFKTEVPLRHTYVRLILKLLAFCTCRLIYEKRKQIIVGYLDRSLVVVLQTNPFGRRHV